MSLASGIGNYPFLFSPCEGTQMSSVVPPERMPLKKSENAMHFFFQQLNLFLPAHHPGASFAPLHAKTYHS
jgi:hypothetical protein